MSQTFFTPSGPGRSKRLCIQSTVPKLDLLDGTVIRWQRADFAAPRTGEKVRIAAFDLDETLISTKSGSVFAKHGHDWRLLEHMTTHLAALARDDPTQRTLVVVFTNQGGVVPQSKAKSYQNVVTKIGGILDALPTVSLVYAAARAATPEQRARYRKPGRGMFELLKKDLAPGEISMATSFYVGDAAGRPRDHSADDKNFAEAVGLRFFTPEEWLESRHSGKSKHELTAAADTHKVSTESTTPANLKNKLLPSSAQQEVKELETLSEETMVPESTPSVVVAATTTATGRSQNLKEDRKEDHK